MSFENYFNIDEDIERLISEYECNDDASEIHDIFRNKDLNFFDTSYEAFCKNNVQIMSASKAYLTSKITLILSYTIVLRDKMVYLSVSNKLEPLQKIQMDKQIEQGMESIRYLKARLNLNNTISGDLALAY